MRITNSMMINQFLSESNDALNRVSKYQSQVDSTKRINKISDDPQATLMALRARNKLSNLDLYKSNVSTASSYLKEAETAANELNEVLKSAYDDIMSASSGSKTIEDQKVIAEDLKNLQAEILSISNTSLGTSYIFGGYNYTGSVSGGTKTPPFTVSGVTGDLTYNGINLSQFAWNDEYVNQTSQMGADVTSIRDIAAKFLSTSTDSYKKVLAQSAVDDVNKLIASVKTALDDAKAFGINTGTSANYTALSTYLYGTDDTATPPNHTPGLVDYANTLYNEMSKPLTGEYILDTDPAIIKNGEGSIDYAYYQSKGINVYTASELASMTANDFNSTSVGTAFSNVYNYLTGSTAPTLPAPTITPALPGTWTPLWTPTPTPPATPAPSLAGNLGKELYDVLNPATNSPQAALDIEKGKTTKFQIGTSQTVDVTLTGLDLLGTGSNNIYHVLGKAVAMLNKGASADELTGLITSIQNAQSQVLTQETKIGATQNRLTLITNRYTDNEYNYTEMRSTAEDADVTESYMHLTTAQQVYNAALAGGSEIIKTSLIDFLR